jgi:hypothetical protein
MEAGAQSEQELRDRALERLKEEARLSWPRVHLFGRQRLPGRDLGRHQRRDGFFWPIFPILGWGIGVAASAWDVYGRKPISEDEIRREADRLRG